MGALSLTAGGQRLLSLSVVGRIHAHGHQAAARRGGPRALERPLPEGQQA